MSKYSKYECQSTPEIVLDKYFDTINVTYKCQMCINEEKVRK